MGCDSFRCPLKIVVDVVGDRYSRSLPIFKLRMQTAVDDVSLDAF
jgi:hypothetical protein